MISELLSQADILLKQSQIFHAGLQTATSLVSSEQIEEEQRKRERFKTEIDKCQHEIDKQIDSLSALKRLLRIEKQTMSTDIRELDTHRWNAIHEEKESAKPKTYYPSQQ